MVATSNSGLPLTLFGPWQCALATRLSTELANFHRGPNVLYYWHTPEGLTTTAAPRHQPTHRHKAPGPFSPSASSFLSLSLTHRHTMEDAHATPRRRWPPPPSLSTAVAGCWAPVTGSCWACIWMNPLTPAEINLHRPGA
jgi:hypothetical protein